MDYEIWTIEPDAVAPWLYNVWEKKVTQNGKTKGKEFRAAIAYGCKFEEALKIIAHLAADKSSIGEFIKSFNETLTKLTNGSST